MPFRPQFAYPPPPPGFEYEEFEYYFDQVNTPALVAVPIRNVPLQLEPDAEYRLRALQISGNTANLVLRLWSPQGDQLSETLFEVDRGYSSVVGNPPVGRLPVPLADEIVCPPGCTLSVDLDLT